MKTPSDVRFITDSGIEVPGVTTAQMREVDRIATEETGPNLFQMMENAGRNLAELALEHLGARWPGSHVVVLAGAGGNGAGGIVAARHLANRGMRISLCLAAPEHFGEVPAWQLHVFRSTRGEVIRPDDLGRRPVDLVLDALIGYGLTGAPTGVFADLVRWANATRRTILSLDVPSGVDSTTGEAPGDYVQASTTMTLALPKTGLRPDTTGRLLLADIGIPQATYERMGLAYQPPFGGRYRVPLAVQVSSPEWRSHK